MKIAVVGSGQAALSTAEALVERGFKPVILDVGETLPVDAQERVETMAAIPPDAWPAGADHFPPPRRVGRLKKTVFGSDYLYADDRPYAPLQLSGTIAAPSFAKGGFSVGWGGAALPAHGADLGAWPFAADRLDGHYAGALKTMAVAGRHDRLSESFPLYRDDVTAVPPTAQGAGLLHDLERAEGHLNRDGDRVLFGAARLSVDGARCVKCAMCLTGCPYGLISPLNETLKRMIAGDTVSYQPCAYVVSVEEANESVTVNWLDTVRGERRSDIFDRVFIGAGALSSARIVLNSMQAYDQTVPVLDSAKFVVPMVRLPGAPLEWPMTNTLADLFLEAILADISERWLHVQISPLNGLMLDALHMRAAHEERQLNALGRLSKPLITRMMAAWCAMHSDLSDELRLSVSRGTDDLPVLKIGAGKARSKRFVGAYARRLAKMGLKFRTLFAAPAAMMTPPAATGHCGGSFPMRGRPSSPYESDVLGRPNGWTRIHLVDASTFPSIPATTIALLIRANARRIVAETWMGEAS